MCQINEKESNFTIVWSFVVINFFSMSSKFYDHNAQQNCDAEFFEVIVDGLKPRNIK